MQKNRNHQGYLALINEVILCQRQTSCRFGITEHSVRLDTVTFWVDMHLGHDVVELHVGFADVAAVFDSFDAFLQVVGLDYACVEGGLGDEGDGGGGDEGLGILVSGDGLDGGK